MLLKGIDSYGVTAYNYLSGSHSLLNVDGHLSILSACPILQTWQVEPADTHQLLCRWLQAGYLQFYFGGGNLQTRLQILLCLDSHRDMIQFSRNEASFSKRPINIYIPMFGLSITKLSLSPSCSPIFKPMLSTISNTCI